MVSCRPRNSGHSRIGVQPGPTLAIFEACKTAINFEKKGAGIVERYYGTASSAPAAVFPLLCRLARHHLSKVRKDDEAAAKGIDREIGEIHKVPVRPAGLASILERFLTLPEQGCFALGFYQQRGYDRACSLVLSNLGKARELREKQKPFDEPLSKARELAAEFVGYEDLIATVNEFVSNRAQTYIICNRNAGSGPRNVTQPQANYGSSTHAQQHRQPSSRHPHPLRRH